jgi:hypothetical protein
VTNVFNTMASILLYTLLCGIYATLLVILLAFGPRWLWQLPDLPQGLALRLTLCNVAACLVFALHAFSYGRLVIAPPKRVFWWYRYGVLELVPAVLFLVLMQPTTTSGPKQQHQPGRLPSERTMSDIETGAGQSRSGGGGTGRSSKQQRRPQQPELIPLVKKSDSYGASIGDA